MELLRALGFIVLVCLCHMHSAIFPEKNPCALYEYRKLGESQSSKRKEWKIVK